jgi:hypothetical protein
MNCREIIEEIIAESGRPVLTPEVEKHVSACQTCAEVYLEHQALWRRMDAWEAPDVSPGFDQRLFVRIGRRASEPWAAFDWVVRLLRPLQPSFATALACMLVIATIVVERGRHAPLPSPEPNAAIHAQERDDPKQIEMALDDIQMLSDFDILPVGEEGRGKS